MKEQLFYTITGTIGGIVAFMFGGWSEAIITLLVFMAVDYITGLTVAGVFKKSKKSANGALESRAGFKGLCRKGVVLLVVLVAVRLDTTLHTTYIKDAVVIGFITNECISIIENVGLMGLPVPNAILKAIDILKDKDKEKK